LVPISISPVFSFDLFLLSIIAAPGADNDGSGTVTILKALCVLFKAEGILNSFARNTGEFY
jgi:leucyl aminopeptidase